MNQHPHPFVPVPVRPRHDGWMPERQIAFIEALAESGCVGEACGRVGMSTESAYTLRRHLGGRDFRLAWDAALDFAIRRLSDAAFSRALHGVVVPHFYKGELIGEHRRYDEALTRFLLRYRDPLRYSKARDRDNWDGHDESVAVELAVRIDDVKTSATARDALGEEAFAAYAAAEAAEAKAATARANAAIAAEARLAKAAAAKAQAEIAAEARSAAAAAANAAAKAAAATADADAATAANRAAAQAWEASEAAANAEAFAIADAIVAQAVAEARANGILPPDVSSTSSTLHGSDAAARRQDPPAEANAAGGVSRSECGGVKPPRSG